jgi:Cu-Zn family superoxide dismutase
VGRFLTTFEQDRLVCGHCGCMDTFIPAILVAVTAIAMTSPASACPSISDLMSGGGDHEVSISATFVPYRPGALAVTYDRRLLPVGARVKIRVVSRDSTTTTRLTVRGLVPNRAYGAHAHTKPCGPNPTDAGPHYQNVPDPVQPSVDPRYANPRNEIWLDFTTDARGDATAVSTVPWRFTARHAHSVVVHTMHTHTGPGHAGDAGARLGCVNVDF